MSANKGGTAEGTFFRPLNERSFFIFYHRRADGMLSTKKIGFIGAGSMAEAILDGLFAKGKVPKENVFIMNRVNRFRLGHLANKYQLPLSQFDQEKVHQADVLILAVKPNDVIEVLKRWERKWTRKQLLISVVAGISTSLIESMCHERLPVIRTMPNTSCTVGLSATGIACGKWVTSKQLELAKEIFGSIGSVYPIEEKFMDVVTGLSGSGPAYFYYMVEALENAGIEAGLERETARSLTIQTLIGAAQMLKRTGKSAEDLRKEVTSPGGTTMAGLEVLNRYQFDEVLKKAVFRAKERSREMGEQLKIRVSGENR